MSTIEESLAKVGTGIGRVTLVLSDSFTQNDINSKIAGLIAEKKYRTIVITTNNPSPLMKELYAANGIDISKIFFIDAITKYALGSLPEDIDNAIFINNPSNLTDVGIVLTEMLKENPDEKTCIILDSINTMLIYSAAPVVTKFIHFLSSKLKLMKASAFYLAVDGGIDPVIMKQMHTFADESITVEGDLQ